VIIKCIYILCVVSKQLTEITFSSCTLHWFWKKRVHNRRSVINQWGWVQSTLT